MSLAELTESFRSLDFDAYLNRRNFDEIQRLVLKGLFDRLKLQLTNIEQRFGVLLCESITELQGLHEKLCLLDSAMQGELTFEEFLIFFSEISTICNNIANSEIHTPGTKLDLVRFLTLKSIFYSLVAFITIGGRTIRKV